MIIFCCDSDDDDHGDVDEYDLDNYKMLIIILNCCVWYHYVLPAVIFWYVNASIIW